MNQENQPFISRRTLLGSAALGAAVIGASVLPALAQDAAPAAPPAAPPETLPAPPAATTPPPPPPETVVINHDAAPTPAPAPGVAAATPATTPAGLSAGDLEIANFALGLERLEASFYAQVRGAQQARAYLSDRLVQVATDIGAIEISHVSTLEAAIIAAGGNPAPIATYRFPGNVFISPLAFTWFGHTLEEIGIGAYLGAVGQIKDPGLRRAAASIYGAEVRHAAVLRSLGGFTFSPKYFETALSVSQVQGLIAPYVS